MFNCEGHHLPYFKAMLLLFYGIFSQQPKWDEHWLIKVEHCTSHSGGGGGFEPLLAQKNAIWGSNLGLLGMPVSKYGQKV